MQERKGEFRFPLWILWIILFFGFSVHLVMSEDGGNKSTESPEVANETTTKRNLNLTGIPQIDYIYDPNLPRELNGYNLSNYPFFNRIPKNINFSCEVGLKDGFYASVEHGCQLYHHCLFGTRYDFLCANYTAFDQRTFICQFVSEVDCPNSALFFHRNDALYQTVTTTTPAPVVIYVGLNGRRIRPSLLQPTRDENLSQSSKLPIEEPLDSSSSSEDDKLRDSPPLRDRNFPRRRNNNRRRCGPGRRRRCRRPRPRPDYYDYYDYDDYYEGDRRKNRDREYDYEDYEIGNDEKPLVSKQRKRLKQDEMKQDTTVKQDTGVKQESVKQIQDEVNEFESRKGTSTRSPVSKGKAVSMVSTPIPQLVDQGPIDPASVAANRERIFSKSRIPPKIRPPVPLHEKKKYNGIQDRITTKNLPTTTVSTLPPTPSQEPIETEYEEYYEDEVIDPSIISNSRTEMSRLLPTIPSTTTKFLTTTTTKSTTTTKTTTTTTPIPPTIIDTQQYEYEYEDYEDIPTTSSSSTTYRPNIPVVTTTTVSKPSFGPRRYQQRQEGSSLVEISATRTPGIEHQKINEALEAPSKASLRIPYHNKPRPSFLKNSQMLLPVTTHRPMTSTITSEKITTLSYVGSTNVRVKSKFPVFDTEVDIKLPLETVSATERQRNMRAKHRQSIQPTTTQQPIVEEYVGFQEADNEEEVTERYGDKIHTDSYLTFSRQEYIQPQSVTYPKQRQDLTPSVPTYPSYIQQQRKRLSQFETNRGSISQLQPTSSLPTTIQYSTSNLGKNLGNRPEYISLISEDDYQQDQPLLRQRQHQQSKFLSSSPLNSRILMSSAQENFPLYTQSPTRYPLLLDQYLTSRSVSMSNSNPIQFYSPNHSQQLHRTSFNNYPAYEG